MSMKKIVFAGGTHSGKTSLVEYFHSEGYETLSESGIAIINLLTGSMGWEEYRAWRMSHPDEFLARIADYHIARESEMQSARGVVFLDRGVLDYAAMAAHMGVLPPRALLEHARGHPYAIVFICDTLSRADQRTDEGRFFTAEDSLAIRRHAERLYREYGYDPVVLPDIPIEKRVAMIKQVLAIH